MPDAWQHFLVTLEEMKRAIVVAIHMVKNLFWELWILFCQKLILKIFEKRYSPVPYTLILQVFILYQFQDDCKALLDQTLDMFQPPIFDTTRTYSSTASSRSRGLRAKSSQEKEAKEGGRGEGASE